MNDVDGDGLGWYCMLLGARPASKERSDSAPADPDKSAAPPHIGNQRDRIRRRSRLWPKTTKTYQDSPKSAPSN